jgi:hypothetical protein
VKPPQRLAKWLATDLQVAESGMLINHMIGLVLEASHSRVTGHLVSPELSRISGLFASIILVTALVFPSPICFPLLQNN